MVGLALVHTIVQLPFSVFLLRNSFEAVPKALEEAAVIDGCNSWQTLWRVFMPLVKAGIVTVILFAFIASWNEFLGALIFMNRETQFHHSDHAGERAQRPASAPSTGVRCRPASSSPSSRASPSMCFCRSTTCPAFSAAR